MSKKLEQHKPLINKYLGKYFKNCSLFITHEHAIGKKLTIGKNIRPYRENSNVISYDLILGYNSLDSFIEGHFSMKYSVVLDLITIFTISHTDDNTIIRLLHEFLSSKITPILLDNNISIPMSPETILPIIQRTYPEDITRSVHTQDVMITKLFD